MRKTTDNLINELDKLIQSEMPEFYEGIYQLEVFCDTESKWIEHIDNYLNIILNRNRTQGKDGTYSGYLDNPFNTIQNIIRINELVPSQGSIEKIFQVAKDVLTSDKQLFSEKINALQLIIFLRVRFASNTFFGEEMRKEFNSFEIMIKNGSNNDFLGRDSNTTLEFAIQVCKIAFGDDKSDDVMDILSLVSNSEPYEKIKSLDNLNLLLNSSADFAIHDSSLQTIFQYIISTCYETSFEVRYRAVAALFHFIKTRHAKLAVNYICKMMNDNDFRIKLYILRKLEDIQNIDPNSYHFVLSKGKIDKNYLVRREANNML